jgi:hypothetical protein
VLTPSVDRPLVSGFYPLAIGKPGFTTTLSSYGGTRTICAEAVLDSGGTKALGCKTVTLPGGVPFGALESAKQFGPRAIDVTGYAFDPDTTDAIKVEVTVNGVKVRELTADVSRPLIGLSNPGYGSNHGYAGRVTLTSAGTKNVCVRAINVGLPAGTTTTQLPSCRSVVIRSGNPFGSFDGTTRTSVSQVRVKGWAIDPDTTNAVAVHAYVNGAWGGAYTANALRTDVGAAYPGFGNNHGMGFLLNARAGASVCLYLINQGAGTSNPLVGCRTVP